MSRYNNYTDAQYFLDEKSCNLLEELTTIRTGDIGDPNLEVECFIHQVEKFLKTYYEVNYGFNGVFKYENQINNFRDAVVEQALFMLEHPDIRKSLENSINIPKAVLHDLSIDNDAHMYMRKGGFANV